MLCTLQGGQFEAMNHWSEDIQLIWLAASYFIGNKLP